MLTVSLSRNYLTWTNTEPGGVLYEVAHRPVAGTDKLPQPNPNPSYPISVAKRRAITNKDIMAGVAAYGAQDTIWLIPAAVFPATVTPKRSDVITDSRGDRWTALDVQLQAVLSTWRFSARNLVLAEDLRDTVTIERADITFDSAGARIKTWPTGPLPQGGKILYSLAAKVQDMTIEVADQRGIRGAVGKVAVVVSRQITIDPERDRVRLSSGSYLDILGYHDTDRDDILPSLDCERRS